jgi:hypothetical protein
MLRVCYNIGETFQSICIGRLGGIEGEISSLSTLMHSDDTTNIHPDQRPNNCDGPRGWM